MALSIVALLENPKSFFGLGFFVLGTALLFRLGFFERHRLAKLVVSMGYLLGIETFSTIRSKGHYYDVVAVIFYILAFLLFFYLMFSDKLMVFLNEPKDKLSLSMKGLSSTESDYVLAIVSGKSVKETAFEAGVSESTVRNIISRGYKKLGVANKSGLMALAEKYDITL